MCGRFLLYTPPSRLARLLDAEIDSEIERQFRPSWNVPPTRRILGATEAKDGKRAISTYRWGLIPSWTKDPSKVGSTFNARGERVASAPTFRAPFKRQRLLIPCDGFYEWRTATDKPKTPYLFQRADGQPLVFAGLWDHWRDPSKADDEQPWLRSCTIITTAAGPDMDGIHDRMPVILQPSAWDRWLDPELEDRDELESFLVAAEPGTLQHRPVGRAVGSISNDGPQLVDRVDSADDFGDPSVAGN